MKRLLRRHALALAVLALAASAAGRSRAGVIVMASEVGGDVVFSGGGTIDLAGLTVYHSSTVPIATAQGFINPSVPELGVGPLVNADVYSGFTSVPSNFGPGGDAAPTSSTGDTFAVSSRSDFRPVVNGLLAVPAGYVSGDSLSASSTYSSATFVSLGMTPGTYVWTWGSGRDADSLTLHIGSAVPEPSTLALTGIGAVIGAGFWLRRRTAGASRESA